MIVLSSRIHDKYWLIQRAVGIELEIQEEESVEVNKVYENRIIASA